MGLEEIVFFALVAVILGIPAVAISARLALRPMVEAIVRLREAFAASGQAPRIVSLEAQVSELRGETQRLRAEVQRLAQAEEFHRQLKAPAASDSIRSDAEGC